MNLLNPKASIHNNSSKWTELRIGITGANGSLGRSLTKKLKEKGAFIIGITHSAIQVSQKGKEGPNEWVRWNCGNESDLDKTLVKLDILVLNHGINPQGKQSSKDLSEAIEVNALSTWRLINRFEEISQNSTYKDRNREIWINTSEAEIQPAFSPAYEISKKLIGQLVSIKWNNYNKKETIKIRKLILGPFKSDLNPLGILPADIVASIIIKQVEINLGLIIVTPNPITYILIPILELIRSIYNIATNKLNNNHI